MMPSQITEYLRAKAKRCRELAESASDQEAAAALRQMADDMDVAAVTLEGSVTERGGNDNARRRASV